MNFSSLGIRKRSNFGVYSICVAILIFALQLAYSFKILVVFEELLPRASTFVMPIFASLLILLFAVLVRIRNKDLLHNTEVQDGFYVLGFCGTLSSLIVSFSFIVLNSNDGITVSSLSPIISQNASALSTTFFGLMIRVYLIHKYPSDVEDEPSIDLNNLNRELEKINKITVKLHSSYLNFASSLRPALEFGGDQLKTWEEMTENAQNAASFFERINNNVRDTSANVHDMREGYLDFQDQYVQRATIINDNLDELISVFKKNNDYLIKLQSELSKKYEGTINRTNSLMEVVDSSVSKVEQSARTAVNLIDNGTDEASKKLNKLSQDIENVENSIIDVIISKLEPFFKRIIELFHNKKS